MLGPMLAQMPPELKELLPNITGALGTQPNVFYVNADERAFRATTSNNINADASVALIVAAIAIPNLLRARGAANEAAAMASVRSVNTAQGIYSVTYPRKGYAPNLAMLGLPPGGDCSGTNITSAHACLLGDVLGDASCTTGKWCEKGAYRYSVRGVCLQASCKGYVVTATPIKEDRGGKSFCSSTDMVLRTHTGPPLTTPLTTAECKTWEAIH
jgi:type IV pilus assembly protein PilA